MGYISDENKKGDGNGLEDDSNVFTLTDENGQEFQFNLLDFVDLDEEVYAVLAPADEDDDSDEVGIVVLKTVMDGNDPIFTVLEDESVGQRVVDEFMKRMDEYENGDFDDEDDDEIEDCEDDEK